jgi:hypothetical protein
VTSGLLSPILVFFLNAIKGHRVTESLPKRYSNAAFRASASTTVKDTAQQDMRRVEHLQAQLLGLRSDERGASI